MVLFALETRPCTLSEALAAISERPGSASIG